MNDGQPEADKELLKPHAGRESSAYVSDQAVSICGMLAVILTVQQYGLSQVPEPQISSCL